MKNTNNILNVFNEFDEAKAKLPKKSIIKISYINVKERNAIPGEVANHMPTYDDPSDEAMERAKENYKAKYSNESKDTVELPEVPDLESFKKAYEDAVKVRESKEQPVTDAQQEVDSATKELDTLKAIERKTEKATAKVQGIEDKITNLTTKAEEQQKVVDQLELDNVKYVEKMTKLAADLDAAQKDVEESAKLLDQAKALQKKTEDEISKLNTKIVELESDVKATEEELNKAKTDLEKIRMDRIQLDQNKEKLAKAQEEKAKLEEELKNLTTELDSIKKQLLEDTKEFEKIQRQYKLENFKWAVLADNNTIDPIEFDLEKYLRDEEEKKRQSEIIPEIPETPIKKEKPNLPGTPEDKNPEKLGELGKELNKDLIPGKEQTLEKDQNSGNPVDVAPGKLNNKPKLQRPRINSNGLNTLPNTGESQTGMATVAGLVALAVASRLRKNKENN